MQKTIVGTFDTFNEASSAARGLRDAGFLDNDVNVVANNASDSRIRTGDDTDDRTTRSRDAGSGAATGAIAGGALGGAAGLAIGLMGLAIPGIGPILAAGPIAAALLGAGAGAVAGGLIGGLTELGVPKAHAEYYAEAIRRGGALVTVRADESRVDEVEGILREHGAYDIEDRVIQWRSAGWTGYDPEAQPYSFDQIEQDRGRHQAARDHVGTDPGMRS
jgi:hypothetical protein